MPRTEFPALAHHNPDFSGRGDATTWRPQPSCCQSDEGLPVAQGLLPATGKELDPDDRHNLSPSGNSTPGTDVGSFARSYKQIGPVNKEVPSHGPEGAAIHPAVYGTLRRSAWINRSFFWTIPTWRCRLEFPCRRRCDPMQNCVQAVATAAAALSSCRRTH